MLLIFWTNLLFKDPTQQPKMKASYLMPIFLLQKLFNGYDAYCHFQTNFRIYLYLR